MKIINSISIIILLLILELSSCMYYSFPNGGKDSSCVNVLKGEKFYCYRDKIPIFISKVDKARRISNDNLFVNIRIYDTVTNSFLHVEYKDTIAKLPKGGIIIPVDHGVQGNYFTFEKCTSKKDSLLIKTTSDSIKFGLNPKYPFVRITLFDKKWSVAYKIYPFRFIGKG